MGQPTVALFAQAALLTPRRVGVERPERGDNMRPRVIHRAIVEGGPGEQASLLSFSTHKNQRALVALCCLSSWNSFSALISISAESTDPIMLKYEWRIN